jgi:hypothetical protein
VFLVTAKVPLAPELTPMRFTTCVSVLAVFMIASVVAMLNGCPQGKRPFLMIQLCFSNDQDLKDFTQELESIANVEGMTFIDGSGKTERELDAIKAPGRLAPVVNIGIEGEDGVGFRAGNLGLPRYRRTDAFRRDA